MGRCKICGKPTYGKFPYCRSCYEKIEAEKSQKEENKGEHNKESEEKNSCLICGKPSGKYHFCYEHSQMVKNGEIIKCEKCGTWHLAKDPCPKCSSESQPAVSIAPKSTVTVSTPRGNEDEDDDDRKAFKRNAHKIGGEGDNDTVYCLICGKPTMHGHHFCYDCYKKYADKDLFLQISGCKEAAVLAADYKSPKKCSDGHKVKSKTEREIDNYFFNNKIKHIYEASLTLNVNGEVKNFQPDFCLPDWFPDQPFGPRRNLYIEHLGLWEADTNNYDAIAKSKAKIYKENGITVIFTYEQEMDDIDGTISLDLQSIHYGDILGDPNEKK